MASRMKIDEVLENMPSELSKVLKRIGRYQPHPRLPSDWFTWQVAERHKILRYAKISSADNVLEVGCGPQAIATIPLAIIVGSAGRVVALDRGRWGDFWKLIQASGLEDRVIPLQEDARKLPFPHSCFDLAACIHGVRSFENREAIVEAVREMLRVSRRRVFIAESSPVTKNMAQKAHMTMYNLRRHVFLALGRAIEGDLPYFSQQELAKIVEEAGAKEVEAKLVNINMPHHLAWFPSDMIDQIKNEKLREDLKRKWKHAAKMLDKYGEEHPPAVVINAWK